MVLLRKPLNATRVEEFGKYMQSRGGVAVDVHNYKKKQGGGVLAGDFHARIGKERNSNENTGQYDATENENNRGEMLKFLNPFRTPVPFWGQITWN